MIKTKLIKLLADSKKYIAYNIFWQWAALISQIIILYIIANIIAKLYGFIQSERRCEKSAQGEDI